MMRFNCIPTEMALLSLFAVLSASVLSLCDALSVQPRQSSSQYTYVDLSVNNGASVHRASGVLYGVPDVQGQIPSSFYTGMGFNYLSAGGAQDPAATGWIYGGYTTRILEVISNYKTARTYGAQFILKMSDIWGADGTQATTAIWPGDNGSYTEFDRFLAQLVSDLKANSMTTNIKILIWNEPDLGTVFWYPGQARYLAMWSHAVTYLRTNLPGVPIAGPAFANSPVSTNTWWTAFLAQVKADGTAPDVYTWHHEGDITSTLDDLQTTQPNMVAMLNSYGLTVGEFIIDEYGTSAEQVPSGAAWWISRLERYNMSGMRGNWASGAQLHDFLAGLLGKTDVDSATGTGYFANGEWNVYNYYATTMTGYRVKTTGSTDRLMDCYAVVGTNVVRILVGGRVITGTYELVIENLSSLGLATSGTITVHTYQFAYAGVYVASPVTDLGTYAHTYTGNTLSLPIYQTSTTTTWAFEFPF
ncbi:hypothetical protein FRB93_003696 [Tulasnella sp. JGI-2019a]|nr:hypothetical protein FRB93_003696 [Tulasnella sp. JGI-2019a]